MHCPQYLYLQQIYLFLILANLKFDEVNYELMEHLKDGDAFASKYKSQELKIKVPQVVMVFSNNAKTQKN